MNVKQELVKILEEHETTIACAVVNLANWDDDSVTTIVLDADYDLEQYFSLLSQLDFNPDSDPLALELDSQIFLENGCSLSVIDNGKVFWQYNTGR